MHFLTFTELICFVNMIIDLIRLVIYIIEKHDRK